MRKLGLITEVIGLAVSAGGIWFGITTIAFAGLAVVLLGLFLEHRKSSRDE